MYAELKRKKCPICKQEHDNKAYYCKPCKKKWRVEYNLKNREKLKDYEFKRGLKRFYGITTEDYEQMFVSQLGRCAICQRHQDELKRSLAVDHIHGTKKIRGLLCDNCNPGIGYFKESPKLMALAIAYLNKFQKQGIKSLYDNKLKYFPVPCVYGLTSGGASATFSSAYNNQSSPSVAEFLVTRVADFALATIDGQLLAAA